MQSKYASRMVLPLKMSSCSSVHVSVFTGIWVAGLLSVFVFSVYVNAGLCKIEWIVFRELSVEWSYSCAILLTILPF